MISCPCIQCGTPVEFDPCFRLGTQDHGVMCPTCIERDHRDRIRSCRHDHHLKLWHDICPRQFRDTQLERLPYPDKSRHALQWKFEKGIGLNLWGFPDTGKTRTLYLVLQQLHRNGKRIRVFGCGEFPTELADRDFKRSQWVQTLCTVDILAIDDMDKMSLTKDQELVFFGILDRRMNQGKPCLFTHNSQAEQLEYRFRTGKAMVRRIRHFTRSIHFPERNQQDRLL